MQVRKKEVENGRVSVKEGAKNSREINITGHKEIREKLNLVDMDSFKKSIYSLITFFNSDNEAHTVESFINGSIEEIASMSPKDCIENQLIQQILITHHLFMKCSHKANIKDQNPNRVDDLIRNISKLSKLFIEQMKALSNYRNEGQQKVKVEHVYVSEGGQAVFGNISPIRKEGGGEK